MLSVIVATCLAFQLVGPNELSGYRGIMPIKSTRADVERLLGLPTDSKLQTYGFENETVRFHYSKYGCKQPPAVKGWPSPGSEGWNVPPDTVLAIAVTLRQQVPLKSLDIDLSGFKKVRGDSDVPTHFRYINEQAGLIIDLNGDGAAEIVRGFIYQPAAKYKNLRCP